MAKKKAKPIPVKETPAAAGTREKSAGGGNAPLTRRAVLIHTSAAIVLLFAVGVGIHFLKLHVERNLTYPATPPRVVLKNRPAWMSDLLAEQIARTARPVGVHSAFDRQMLADAARMLESNPWIRKVNQIRRVYGERPGDTVEVDCEYRAPVALVHWKDYYWLVDGEGVKLPEQFTAQQIPRIIFGQNKRMNIRVIEGVDRPPPESGQKWLGDDLLAAIDMVKLLYGKPFAEEILRVNVENFQGRRDPREAQLVLETKYNTEIRWGRPVNAKDYFIEVSTAQKLRYMEQVFQEFKRVDGHRQWIDIRFDKITYPSVETDVHASGAP